MCQCPQSIDPPTDKLRTCRRILQGIAISTLALIASGVIAGQYFQMILFGLLIFLLYISWAQFQWCSVLIYFIMCGIQAISAIINLAQLIQFQYIFERAHIEISIFVVLEVIYFPVAFVLSHYVYKNFKDYSNQNGMGMFGRMNAPDGGAANQQENRGPLMGENNQYQQGNSGNRPEEPVPTETYFKGQAVRIG